MFLKKRKRKSEKKVVDFQKKVQILKQTRLKMRIKWLLLFEKPQIFVESS